LQASEPTAEVERGPLDEYTGRLGARRAESARLGRLEGTVANLRVVAFAAAAVVGRLNPPWIVAPIAAFAGLIAVHVRLRRAIRRADRAVAFYARGVDRIEGRWSGRGEDGARFGDDAHPFAADLDLFGPGSLFQRINAARTRGGEAALADRLKAPEADPETIRDRQAAVADLAARLDLREELDLLGDEVRIGLDPGTLVAWGESPPLLPDPRPRRAAIGLAILTSATLAGWAAGAIGPVPFLVAALAELGLWTALRGRIAGVLGPLDRRAAELSLLAALLRRLEREEFAAMSLRSIRDGLTGDVEPPSRRIAALARLVGRVDSTRNQLVAPVAAMLMTGTRLAFAVEAWRRRSGPSITGWIAAVGAIEAYGSLGAYAFENPGDVYPEVVDRGPLFDAEGVGHPLLPLDRCVRNTLRLGGELRALVVSGSNMSGKSTMLRTVGTNAVLAMAGAPVRAERLRVSPLAIGATLRVQDSLQAGTSRFYAELTRLRQVVDLAGGSPPLLFLLDEIFHGTNSDDRKVGAEGVVRGLVDRGAIGLVTTHDLALAAIADRLAPAAANVHFADRFDAGTLLFDYTMKPGVVAHSNALALMRAVGLDV